MSYLSFRNPLVVLTAALVLGGCASAPNPEPTPVLTVPPPAPAEPEPTHGVPASPALESESVTQPVKVVESEEVQTKVVPPQDAGVKHPKAVNVICPMEGGVAVEEVTTLYEGDVIGFCCETCKKEWEEVAPAQRKKLMKEALRLSR